LVPSGHTAPFSPLVAPTQGEGRRKGVAGAVLVSLLLLLPACGSNSQNQILVSAAASLTDAFAELEVAFEADNSTVDVILNFAGSSTLREQILEGAPIDVFASANIANMDQVVAAGLTVGTPMSSSGFARKQSPAVSWAAPRSMPPASIRRSIRMNPTSARCSRK
jgi:ABC-type glycerol-3-phosphate transport system substrate-binding protein